MSVSAWSPQNAIGGPMSRTRTLTATKGASTRRNGAAVRSRASGARPPEGVLARAWPPGTALVFRSVWATARGTLLSGRRRARLRMCGTACEADGDMSVLRRILRAIALVITCGTTVPIAVAGTVLASFLFLPLPAVLPQPKLVLESRPTHVHLLDGTEIAVFKDVEQKIEVHPEDIPPVVKKAGVAAED